MLLILRGKCIMFHMGKPVIFNDNASFVCNFECAKCFPIFKYVAKISLHVFSYTITLTLGVQIPLHKPKIKHFYLLYQRYKVECGIDIGLGNDRDVQNNIQQ